MQNNMFTFVSTVIVQPLQCGRMRTEMFTLPHRKINDCLMRGYGAVLPRLANRRECSR